MTRIAESRIVSRETAALHRGRPLIVTLYPRFIEIRPKGLRSFSETVTYEAIYERAIKTRVEQQRKEQATRRRGR